jgi:hypothetical protein
MGNVWSWGSANGKKCLRIVSAEAERNIFGSTKMFSANKKC